MKVTEILTEGMNKRDTFAILHDFVRFAANTLDTTLLPTLYSSNTVVDNSNTVNSVNGVLVAGRPWAA